jgi:hypothetical protein
MVSALAAVILVGMMVIPFLNIAVGLVAGAMLGGFGGAVMGALAGLIITGVWGGMR